MTAKIYIITGEVECGKTRWLQGAIDFLISENKIVAGVITPGIWEDGRKLGIDALLLASQEKFNLAMRNENNKGFSKKWEFNENAMEKINEHFASLRNFDYLVVDELGPLELERGEGLTNAVEILKTGNFDKAYIVVRPHLVEIAKKMFAKNSVVEVIDIEEKSCFELF